MTMSTSMKTKYNRYSIDKRLHVFDEGDISFESDGEQNTESARGTNFRSSYTSAPQHKRSIFTAYWKTDPRPAMHYSETSSCASRQEKASCPLQRKRVNMTYTYHHLQDPYSYFGMDENDLTVSDDDDSSTNEYERALRLQESKPSKIRERSQTLPSLSAATVANCNLLMSAHLSTKSDTVLIARSSTLKRLSCLRKGRFSYNNLSAIKHGSDVCEKNESGRNECGISSCNSSPEISSVTSLASLRRMPSVTFDDSNTRVHWFQPPAETWASSGWSSWFGI